MLLSSSLENNHTTKLQKEHQRGEIEDQGGQNYDQGELAKCTQRDQG